MQVVSEPFKNKNKIDVSKVFCNIIFIGESLKSLNIKTLLLKCWSKERKLKFIFFY